MYERERLSGHGLVVLDVDCCAADHVALRCLEQFIGNYDILDLNAFFRSMNATSNSLLFSIAFFICCLKLNKHLIYTAFLSPKPALLFHNCTLCRVCVVTLQNTG